MTEVIQTPKAEKFRSYKTMRLISKTIAYIFGIYLILFA